MPARPWLAAFACLFSVAPPALADGGEPVGGAPGPGWADVRRLKEAVPLTWELPAARYSLTLSPGITFKQGQAPVRAVGAPAARPPNGAMGVGLGLEGHQVGAHGWQLLTTLAPSPLVPVWDPRLSLHGYALPHPNWGVDGDLGVGLSGGVSAEVGSSLLLWDKQGLGAAAPEVAHQLRLAIGRQTLGDAARPAYDYAQLGAYRYDAFGLGSSCSLNAFCGLDGAARLELAGQRLVPLGDRLKLQLDASAGWGDARLPGANRLGSGLLSQGWLPVAGRLGGRVGVCGLLVQGARLPLDLARNVQVEGQCYVESARVWGLPRHAALGGVGLGVTLAQDTPVGLPLAVSLGYALPLGGGGGQVYVGLSEPLFPRPSADAR